MKAAIENSDKISKTIKKVTIFGHEISEDLLKKMNFAETRKFCVNLESDLRKFIANPNL